MHVASFGKRTKGETTDFPARRAAGTSLPVTLKPGTTYALWVNSEKFRNFKDPDGRSAVPYLLVFKTKE